MTSAAPEKHVGNRSVSLACAGGKNVLVLHPIQQTIYALSRARPLARRRFNTRRPAAVLMRARKPCVRLRLITLG